jgi:2-polyprenyl-3-methyl-5-hydroxy-6-metoxy-1,4-benzoquinol methylase
MAPPCNEYPSFTISAQHTCSFAPMIATDGSADFKADVVMKEVFNEYEQLKLGFVEREYWETLRLSYVRTISDVLRLQNEELCRRPAEIRILEIGAFSGVITTALRKLTFQVTAQDIPLFMRDPSLESHLLSIGAATIASDLRDLPLPVSDESFDVVLCCEVIEHLNFNVLPVLRDFNRVLAPGGFLYLGTPNQANIVKRLLLLRGQSVHDPIERLEWQLDPEATFSIGLHWREYTACELAGLLKMSGFKILKQTYCHYNDRMNSPRWRRVLVSWMYAMCPAFLPGQIAVAMKR